MASSLFLEPAYPSSAYTTPKASVGAWLVSKHPQEIARVAIGLPKYTIWFIYSDEKKVSFRYSAC